MTQILRNPRHEKFCELVVSGIKPSEAYISIGYSANGADQAASRLLRRDDVRARISELQAGAHESAVERCVLSQVWVLESLKKVVQRCMQAEPATGSRGEGDGRVYVQCRRRESGTRTPGARTWTLRGAE